MNTERTEVAYNTKTEAITSVSYLENNYGSIEATFNSATHIPLKIREEINEVIEAYLRNHYGDKYVSHVWTIRTKTFLD